jgi:rRNA maturation RNase YbeY
MAIYFEASGIAFPKIQRRDTKRWLAAVAEDNRKRVGEISYRFCTDDEILRVNQQYLQHDYYTDVITFDYSTDRFISGDVYISLDTVRTNAALYGTDFMEELRRVIAHGLLHLCGFKDKTSADAKRMRQAENHSILKWTQLRNDPKQHKQIQ